MCTSRVCMCPCEFPAGYYWCGGKRKGPGRPPKWVDMMLRSGPSHTHSPTTHDRDGGQSGSAQEEDESSNDPALQHPWHTSATDTLNNIMMVVYPVLHIGFFSP